MTEAKKYIGITIGPIFDTMNLSSSPCALWASSYIFSYVSKRICEKLVDEYNIEPTKIICPFFDRDNDDYKEIFNRNDGTGLFHDRIILEKPEDFSVETISAVKGDVLYDLNDTFKIGNLEYLKQYIMIAAAEYSAENPIEGSSKILDSLELSKTFVPKETANPILTLFNGEKSKNDTIKELVNNLGFGESWQLWKSKDQIKDLNSIAKIDDSGKKYNDYFAVVRADGDRMGKIIKSLEKKEDFNDFSATCLDYCASIADYVKGFGGVTIYAGGDDLLALIPSRGKGEKTVFDFVKDAAKIFNDKFIEYKEHQPSLSLGIMICYKKYPLYEALKKSAGLLFGTAKSESNKNCSVINLQKHSGQSAELIIPNEQIENVLKLQENVLKESEDVLLSASQKILLFESLFNQKRDEKTIHNLFKNTFDASYHSGNDFVQKVLPESYCKLNGITGESGKMNKPIQLTNEDTSLSKSFSTLLRMMKFYVEEGEK